jgi:hypothetical protein
MKYIAGILGILFLLAVGSGIYVWYKTGHSILNTTVYTVAKEIPKAANIAKKKVQPPPTITTIDKPIISAKLELPAWVKDSPDEQVIATAVIEPYKGTTNAIAVMNTKEGTTQIIAKQQPLSFFGFVGEKEIGIRPGIDIKGAMVTSVYASYDFVRVGGVTIGAYGDVSFGSNVSSSGDSKLQLKISYRF